MTTEGRREGGRRAEQTPRACLPVKNKGLSPSPALTAYLGVAGSRWAGEGSSLGQSLCMGDFFFLFCEAFMVLRGVVLMGERKEPLMVIVSIRSCLSFFFFFSSFVVIFSYLSFFCVCAIIW